MQDIASWLLPPLERVQTLKQTNSLSHALLISGAQGVGQEVLAEQIVKSLMCEGQGLAPCNLCHSCQLMQAETHPDYRILDGEDGAIKIDQIRNLVSKISQKPQVGQNKVVLIRHAQAMNINAANAVLKALEEPADRTYFVLTSSQSTSLLPTIRSRCLLLNVPTPNSEMVAGWLNQQEQGEALKALFWLTTQPYRLLALRDDGKLDFYTELPDKLCQFLQSTMSVEQILKGLDSNNIGHYCDALAAILHQCICHSTGAELSPSLNQVYEILMNRCGIRKIMQRYQALQNLKQDLQKTNLNPIMQLTLELNQW
ncbi:DNA polymerase III subunit delta' [Marinomonas dokdonensis]|uniref:DNA polymerase III subunit delta' n=1 Tax=Marinomonas dokdonensis TaxID=328224 RepID=UPI0040559090